MRAIVLGGLKLLVYLALGVAGAVTLFFVAEHNAEMRENWVHEQAAQAAAVRLPFEQAFGSRDPGRILQQCRDGVLQRLGYLPPVVGLAFGFDRVDAYYYRSTRIDSLHRYACTASGIDESRVEHPLAVQVRAEHERQVESQSSLDLPDLWSELQARVRGLRADLGGRIELLLDPAGEGYIARTTMSDGTVETSPQDAPGFPRLYDDGGTALERDPSALQTRPFTRWSSSPGAAFELLARELPQGVRIVSMRLDDDAIEVGVAGPLPGLDAAYGDIEVDNWSEFGTWLYPRDEPPGFGCRTGVPLEVVRQRFNEACARLPVCAPATHYSIAYYSCSGGAGDGRWGLHVQSL